MKPLTRKLIRDLWASRWQYLAVSLMVILGVAFFGAAYMSYQNLDSSYQYSYNRLRFEDFRITVHAAPLHVVERIARIPGVEAVEGRLIEDVAVELPGLTTKKLLGRLVSVPGDRRPAVNDLLVVEGRYLSSRTAREVLLESSFAAHHKLHPGDSIEVVRGSSRARLRVAGIVKSPEYIFVVRSKQEIFPLPETFGVMFLPYDVLGALVGKTGFINEVIARLKDEAQLRPVLHEAKRLLDAYGAEDPIPREDQPSHQLLQQDLEGFQAYSVMFPALFLSVAGLTVYTLLMRMVHLQRPLIGVLRALGYSRREVVWHYVGGALLLGVVSGGIGSSLGFVLSSWLTRWYATFIAVPYLVVVPRWGAIAAGGIMGMGACVAAGISPALAASNIGPAEALRPSIPSAGRILPVDRLLPGILKSPLWRLPLRNLFRHPRRTASTVFGIAAALVLIISAQGLLDSSQAVIDLFIREIAQDDLRVQFTGFQRADLVNRVRSWPGVVWAEPLFEIPVDLKRGNRSYPALLRGLHPGGRLYRLQAAHGGWVQPTEGGVLLGPTLRAQLDVEEGDVVLISVSQAVSGMEVRERAVKVAGFVFEPIGTVAYLPLNKAQQLLSRDLNLPPGAITSIMAKVDPQYLREVKKRMLDLPGAGMVMVQPEFRRMLDDYMALARNYVRLMLLLGTSLAFAVVFNMVTVNIMERANEIATMRTLGIDRWQIAGIITIENLLTALLGSAIGMPMGRALVEGFVSASQSEYFVFRASVFPATYGIASATVLLTVILSQLPALADVHRMDLARATKERAL